MNRRHQRRIHRLLDSYKAERTKQRIGHALFVEIPLVFVAALICLAVMARW